MIPPERRHHVWGRSPVLGPGGGAPRPEGPGALAETPPDRIDQFHDRLCWVAALFAGPSRILFMSGILPIGEYLPTGRYGVLVRDWSRRWP
jgi:hypothetical protein